MGGGRARAAAPPYARRLLVEQPAPRTAAARASPRKGGTRAGAMGGSRTGGNHSRMRELWETLAELKTAKWVTRANAESGVAPTSQAVYLRYVEFCQMAPTEFQLRNLLLTGPQRRTWGTRWRRRWNGCLRSSIACDKDSIDVLREKVQRCGKDGHCAVLVADFKEARAR